MRFQKILICFQFITTSLFGQIDVELYFKNNCDNKVIKLDFNLFNLDNKTDRAESKNGIATVLTSGKYHLESTYIWGDNMVGTFDHIIEIKDSDRYIDTLDIPMIKFTWDGVLHSRYWNYFKCDKLCNGLELDFYPSGQKRLEGEFNNGKPNYIIEYRLDGTKETEFLYVPGTVLFKRVNWFDKTGKLDEYDVYKNGKHRTIKTTYTSQGKKVGREVTKHGIEK
jgi:antitoxin component YwqK of YwqJK toxin-antitoxin module